MKLASGKVRRIFGRLLAGAVVSQAVCLPALAGLGGNADSVSKDVAQMKATVRVAATTSNYTVHEITTSANTVIREYLSSSGQVFAVAWIGPERPDLATILGSYYTDFVTAGSVPHSGHSHLSINRSDLVINSNGHMRHFYGEAYLPNLLPAGFTVADIN